MTSSVPHPAAWLVLAVAVTVALGLGGLASSAPSNAHPSAQSVGAYPWPIRPFNQAHPVRANLGDPRTLFATRSGNPLAAAGTFAFHDGVDIDAPSGTPVYPVASGVAYPLASGSGVGVNAADGRSFEYEHIVPAVSSRQPVTAGQTILGHVHNWAEEVHLRELTTGREPVNPLLPGHLTPYADTIDPTVARVEIRGPNGGHVPLFAVRGRVTLVADAYDTPMPVPQARRRGFTVSKFARDGFPVTPAALTWSLAILGGRTIVPPTTVVDFRRGLPPGAFWGVYARGTYQNRSVIANRMHGLLPGRYLFRLDPSFDTRKLKNGVYVVTVTAVDASGNRSSLSERFDVWNRASKR